MRMRVLHFNAWHCQGHNGLRLEQQYALQTPRSGATPSLSFNFRHPQSLHQKVQACTHHGRSIGSYQNVLRLCD
ncbi:hypothetical protein NDU88_000625 [Pleurodeles waltl]|uniref:Uncharacterized protein n=1 Tax=Pleurodeles waltl TaxID=8319 RepID=A0AAV7VU27_PLEWA|nr:hypothetical protein NDU88_000625 [Pleurodeles waltl]